MRIAEISAPYKDPDEFVQAARGSTTVQERYGGGPDAAAGQAFEEEVVARAKSWVEWIGMIFLEPFVASGRPSGSFGECVGD